MSLDEELTAAQRCLEDLTRSVNRLERRVGSGLEIRRVRSDAEHLRESLSLLRDSAPERLCAGGPELVLIPDAPYDRELWADADDEGLGARDRRAP